MSRNTKIENRIMELVFLFNKAGFEVGLGNIVRAMQSDAVGHYVSYLVACLESEGLIKSTYTGDYYIYTVVEPQPIVVQEK